MKLDLAYYVGLAIFDALLKTLFAIIKKSYGFKLRKSLLKQASRSSNPTPSFRINPQHHAKALSPLLHAFQTKTE